MQSNLSTEIITFIGLLLLSAFFSSTETAYTAISKIKLRNLLDRKIKGSKRLQKILKNPSRLIIGILIGNNIVNVGASALATAVLLKLFQQFHINNLAFEMVIITFIMTLILLIFGEITPKTFAIIYSEKIALFSALPIKLFLKLLSPIIFLFESLSTLILKIAGLNTEKANKIFQTTEEIKSLVNVGEEEGLLETKERQMIHNIFELSNTIVREIMTARPDAVFLDVETSISEAIQTFIEKGHSRIPVYEGKEDNIIGILYAKDLLAVSQTAENISLKKFLREARFIPESHSIENLLQTMKQAKFHLSIVVDEYGGVAGIVTLEDIIEEIIGEIRDEFDINEKPDFEELAPDHYLISARANIDDVAEKLNFEFPKKEDYDTIGGFVLYMLGNFPQKGQKLEFENLLITVREISKRRILKLEIQKLPIPE